MVTTLKRLRNVLKKCFLTIVLKNRDFLINKKPLTRLFVKLLKVRLALMNSNLNVKFQRKRNKIIKIMIK